MNWSNIGVNVCRGCETCGFHNHLIVAWKCEILLSYKNGMMNCNTEAFVYLNFHNVK